MRTIAEVHDVEPQGMTRRRKSESEAQPEERHTSRSARVVVKHFTAQWLKHAVDEVPVATA